MFWNLSNEQKQEISSLYIVKNINKSEYFGEQLNKINYFEEDLNSLLNGLDSANERAEAIFRRRFEKNRRVSK